MKIRKKSCRLNLRKSFFSQRVVNMWNDLPHSVVNSESLNSFKRGVDKYMDQKERKKLTAEINQNFPTLTENDLSTVLPPKADVVLIKTYCNKGETVNIYQIQKEPLFFKIDKNNDLFPSIYLLWKFPRLLKTFSTYPPVISKLQQGADLMLPGIDIKGQVSFNSYGKFEKGTMVAINTTDNACPFAIGKTAMSSVDMYMAARQGKGVIVLHVYQDHLWESGSKSPIPKVAPTDILGSVDGKHEDETNSIEVDTVALNLQDSSLNQDSTADDDAENDKSTGPEAMDELFLYCFLKALKTTAKKTELPLLTSNFYRLHMVNACPGPQALDIKKSSYKKLSKFLREMANQNLVEVKEFPKGVENITAINWAHEQIKSFFVDESEVTPLPVPSSVGSSAPFVPPVLEECYQVSGTTTEFFKRNGLSKGDVLSRADVRAVVTSYIDKHNLKRGDKVEVDPLLHPAVVGPKEGYKEFLRWDEIFSRLLGKMFPAVRISRQGQVPIIRKGKLEPIEIAVAKRTGNKRVTLLYNVATFGIDEDEFAHQIQVGMATSTSVGPAENKPQGTTQILIQGNQVAFVAKLLLDKYNIPRKYIKGLELAVKRKK